MLIETNIRMMLFLPELLLSMLPQIELELPDNVLAGLGDVFGAVGYFFPVAALLPILIISIAMDLFQIIMAIVVRIKSFVPTMGA